MNIKFLKFFFDEKDVFLILYLVLIVLADFFEINLSPFSYSGLLVVGIFALITRGLVSSVRFDQYFYIFVAAVFLSLFFSGYTIGLYLAIALVWYTRKYL